MTKITFGLIKTHCPAVLGLDSGVDVDADKDVLTLNGLGIDEIDGLEIVESIAELHLSHNNITKIENIEFLSKLRVLDLSYNNISPASLREGINCLPSSLTSINLLNNPCCQDENILCQLQDRFPALGIIVGYDEESVGNDNDDEIDDAVDTSMNQMSLQSYNRPMENEDIDISRYQPLNADDILREVVERKCKYSSLPTFNLEQAVQVKCLTMCNYIEQALLYSLLLFRNSIWNAKLRWSMSNIAGTSRWLKGHLLLMILNRELIN
jgi:hypothetical protein